MKARTVQETSSGSVHSGMAVATTCMMTAAFSAQYPATRRRLNTNLVGQLTPVVVVWIENLSPEFQSPSFDEMPSLLLEHRVVVGHRDELLIAEAFCICNIGQRRIALLAVLSDDQWFVQLKSHLM